MVTDSLWQAPEGLSVINSVVSKKIPQWKDGLQPHQLEAILLILDHQGLLNYVVTGSGKTASFMVPILIHEELHQNPLLYPKTYVNLACQLPIGVMVTTTQGLSSNLVCSLMYACY